MWHLLLRRQIHGGREPAYKAWFKGSNWRVPSIVGFAVIGAIQWTHLQRDAQIHPSKSASGLGHEDPTCVEKNMVTERQFQALQIFPYRIASRCWGWVHSISLYVVVTQEYQKIDPYSLP